MADKEKRLRKILVKKGFNGKVKPVGSLEEARIVLIKDKIVAKYEYIEMVENGYKFSEEDVYYLTL